MGRLSHWPGPGAAKQRENRAEVRHAHWGLAITVPRQPAPHTLEFRPVPAQFPLVSLGIPTGWWLWFCRLLIQVERISRLMGP